MKNQRVLGLGAKNAQKTTTLKFTRKRLQKIHKKHNWNRPKTPGFPMEFLHRLRLLWWVSGKSQAAEGRMDAQSLYSVVAHNRFIEDLTEKVVEWSGVGW